MSTLSVIWEETVDWRECIRVLTERFCIRIEGAIRLVYENSNYYLEVDAFGRRWRENLTRGCFVIYEAGIARFTICAEPRSNGVRILLRGCIGVRVGNQNFERCWTILAEDITWFMLHDLDTALIRGKDPVGDLSGLIALSGASSPKAPIFATMQSALTATEEKALLALK